MIDNTFKDLEKKGKISFFNDLYKINDDVEIHMDLRIKNPDK